jgi:hypothetical protein
MKKFLRKIILATCAFTLLNAHADSLSQHNDTEHQVKPITPIASPRVENGADVFITADFILWEATQKGFPFAYTNTIIGDTVQGAVYYPNYQFDPGFQVGFGLELGHDGWDTLVNYTWFHTENHKRTVKENPELAFYQSGSEITLWNGSMDFRFLLDVIDFEIGRSYYISEDLAFRPFGGIKVAWNREHAKQYLDDIISVFSVETRQKAFEIGLRAGLDSNYKINKNWSIFGNLAFAVLSGDVESVSRATETNTNPEVVLANFRNKVDTIQPVVELSMGICWDIWSESEEYHLGVSASYDIQYWNNNLYTKVPVIDPSTNKIDAVVTKAGDLSIQGLNIKFRFDF